MFFSYWQNEATRLRLELEATRTKLSEAERQATAATTTAELSDQRAADAAEQLRLATSQLDVMRVSAVHSSLSY